VRCLYFLADGGDRETVRLAEDHDFRLVDFRITLSSRLKAHSEWARSGAIRPVRSDDIPPLQRIAAVSYTDSRFFFDSKFPQERSKALYETWIQKSCKGYADMVLVAIVQEKPVGYISCHLEPEARGQIGLLGVDPMSRGIGIGGQLVTEALNWFMQHEVHTISVVTQGRNVTALRLYERYGFLTDSTELWYHRWFCDEVTGEK
jgi:ribosomal protein S18 acetylase RimI-like enzyme